MFETAAPRHRRERGMASMRVAQISEFGGIQALRLEEVVEPSPGPGEVLIKVTAVGLNFFDTLSLRNKYQVTPKLPYSPEPRSPARSGRWARTSPASIVGKG